jgi:hypothetical protein
MPIVIAVVAVATAVVLLVDWDVGWVVYAGAFVITALFWWGRYRGARCPAIQSSF